MVGFIGALSSSLCILILVFITLLLSYVDSLLPTQSMFKVTQSTDRLPVKSYFIGDDFENEMKKAILKIELETKKKPELAMVGCTIGFDMNEKTATNIMAYNAIKLINFELDIEVQIFKKPVFNDQQLNYCFIDFEAKKTK